MKKTYQKLEARIFSKKGKLLAVGNNSYKKTHPYQKKLATQLGHPQKLYLHAEIAALVKCKGVPHKISISRYDKAGNPKLAKPCLVCEEAIRLAGIKVIEYTM